MGERKSLNGAYRISKYLLDVFIDNNTNTFNVTKISAHSTFSVVVLILVLNIPTVPRAGYEINLG